MESIASKEFFSYELVLICSHRCEGSEVKNESFMPHATQVYAMTRIPLITHYHEVNSGLKLVHRI